MSSKQISSSFIADVFFHLVQVVVDPRGGTHHLETVLFIETQGGLVLFGAGQTQDLPAHGPQDADGLAQKLDPDKFQIVLVGTDDTIDKQLPSNIISIHRTANQTELAEIYAAADLFVNPTREDTFPTVNMESLACGTPVLTFRTGGSPEILDETCGRVVDCNDEEAMYQAILDMAAHPLNRDDCLRRAAAFDEKDRFREYAALYGEVSE
jgi:glycosyltransferase involved in cell wall biosynthesis